MMKTKILKFTCLAIFFLLGSKPILGKEVILHIAELCEAGTEISQVNELNLTQESNELEIYNANVATLDPEPVTINEINENIGYLCAEQYTVPSFSTYFYVDVDDSISDWRNSINANILLVDDGSERNFTKANIVTVDATVRDQQRTLGRILLEDSSEWELQILQPGNVISDPENLMIQVQVTAPECDLAEVQVEIFNNDDPSVASFTPINEEVVGGSTTNVEGTVNLITRGLCSGESCFNKNFSIEARGLCDEIPGGSATKDFSLPVKEADVEFVLNPMAESGRNYRVNIMVEGLEETTIDYNDPTVTFEDLQERSTAYAFTATLFDGEEERNKINGNFTIKDGENQTVAFSVRGGLLILDDEAYWSNSNQGIAACAGSVECANCIARANREGARFSSFEDAAQAEIDGTIIYTNNIYSAVGCVDPSQDGLTTRILQIAFGVIGGLILVRLGQAVIILQSGHNPEAQQEGSEIAWSALLALMLLVFSVVGLRFLGINVFYIFSPGTIEIGE